MVHLVRCLSSLVVLFAAACNQSHGPASTRDGGSGDGGASSECGECARPCCRIDPASGETVAPFCPPVGFECGGPPSCEPLPCPAPPPGCRYEPTDPCECGPIVCPPPEPSCDALLDYDQSCMADFNCFVGLHQTDCCGSLVAVGVGDLVGAHEAWNAAEMDCRATYPACMCAPRPTVAEDGRTASDPSTVAVRCVGARCETYVP